ncbi:site-2 protease family protein [Undibacterium sp. JH2W]|uniref:site-2 protease family protein n=1 Tax=Undibacterium sp. JH2W TaxID=3413037 RepID=UPI003BF39390
MDLVWTVGVTVVAVVLLLQVLVLLIGMNRLLKLQLWAPRKTASLRTACGDLLPVLDAARIEMEAAGFRYMHSWRERSMVAANDIPASYCDVYHHLGQDVHAEVYPTESPYDKRLYTIYLWNTYIDGKALLTVNGGMLHTIVPYPSRVTVIDDKSKDFAGQLATHLHVRELITVQRSDPAEAPQIAQNLVERWLVRLEREGKVYQRSQRGDETIYGFRILPALKMAWNMRKANQQKRSQVYASNTNLAADIAVARQLRDRYAFMRTLCALRSMQAPRWYQYTGFTLSALAFLALGAWWWGLAGAVLIGAIIALHEAGHWLAMKLAGFRDVQVFFIPGMGGVTSGEKHEARPLTHMLVYLAGPMPGLILSLASFALIAWQPDLLNTTWGPYLSMAALASLLVNGFNLLPVLPLDGGRIIELLIVARLPWLRFLFSLASGLAMLVYGLNLGDKVLLGIGMLIVFSARFQFKLARAASLLLQQKVPPAKGNKNFAREAGDLFDFLSHASFSKWNYASKLAVGQNLLTRYLGGLPGWKESSAGLGIYLACIIFPVAALLGLFYASPDAMLHMAGQGFSGILAKNDTAEPVKLNQAQASKSWEEERNILRQTRADKIAAAQGDERASILKNAFEEAGDDDPEDALRIAKIYYAENNNSVQATYFHADAAFAMAIALRQWSGQDEQDNKSKNDTDIANYLQEAEAILRARLHTQGDKNDARLLAEILQTRDSDTDNPTQLILRQEIVKLFAKDKDQDDTQLLRAHQALARSYYTSGRAAEAAQELQMAETDYDCATKKTDNYLCHSLKLNQAWLLVGEKKFEEAKQVLAPFATVTKSRSTDQQSSLEEHQIKWLIAILQKNYKQAKQEALAVNQVFLPDTGNWLTDVLFRRMRPASSYHADLMLIESLRGAGDQDEATKINERLLETQRKKHSEYADSRSTNSERPCTINTSGSAWKNPLQQSLLSIEQRETKCVPRLNTNQISR